MTQHRLIFSQLLSTFLEQTSHIFLGHASYLWIIGSSMVTNSGLVPVGFFFWYFSSCWNILNLEDPDFMYDRWMAGVSSRWNIGDLTNWDLLLEFPHEKLGLAKTFLYMSKSSCLTLANRPMEKLENNNQYKNLQKIYAKKNSGNLQLES